MNAAVRAQDRAAIRALMQHREATAAASSSAAVASGLGTGTAARRSSPGADARPIMAEQWAGPPKGATGMAGPASKGAPEVALPADAGAQQPLHASGGPTVTIRVKFGRELLEVQCCVADGVCWV
jgi:hypothetical protein